MLDKLKEIEFHDSGLINLNIDFDQSKIEIIIEKEVGVSRTFLVFEQVSSLKINEIRNLKQFYCVEVYDAEFDQIENIFTAKFIFLLGFSTPDWMIEFTFKTVKVT